jgi:amino acid transporter
VAAGGGAPPPPPGNLATGGLPYVLTSRLGTGLGRVLLVDVAIAITVCTLAVQTAASRMMFSMSRDGVLPFSGVLRRVSPRTGTPILPSIAVGVVALLILLINLGQAQIFTAVTSVAVVLVYLAYLLVTGPVLIARLRGTLSKVPDGHFSLGRWAVPVNVLAVLWGLGMAVNMAWPRAEVYDPAGNHWYLRYFAVLLLTVVLAVGVFGYRRTSWQTAAVPAPLST